MDLAGLWHQSLRQELTPLLNVLLNSLIRNPHDVTCCNIGAISAAGDSSR